MYFNQQFQNSTAGRWLCDLHSLLVWTHYSTLLLVALAVTTDEMMIYHFEPRKAHPKTDSIFPVDRKCSETLGISNMRGQGLFHHSIDRVCPDKKEKVNKN